MEAALSRFQSTRNAEDSAEVRVRTQAKDTGISVLSVTLSAPTPTLKQLCRDQWQESLAPSPPLHMCGFARPGFKAGEPCPLAALPIPGCS